MASNQLSIAEKARIIADEFVVPSVDIARIQAKNDDLCTALELEIKKGNYKIPYDEVRKIQKKQICDCSTLELKIRYNDPDLGKLPDWFDIKYVSNLINCIAKSTWTGELVPVYSVEDLYSICWDRILTHTKEIYKIGEEKYLAYLNTTINNCISNVYLFHRRHKKYEDFSTDVDILLENNGVIGDKCRLPDVIFNANALNSTSKKAENLDVKATKNEKKDMEDYSNSPIIVSGPSCKQYMDDVEWQYENNSRETDMVELVSSINDVIVRDLISLTAFLIAGLPEFEGLYNEAVNRLGERFSTIEAVLHSTTKRLTFNKITKLVAGELADTYKESVKDYMEYIHHIMTEA